MPLLEQVGMHSTDSREIKYGGIREESFAEDYIEDCNHESEP